MAPAAGTGTGDPADRGARPGGFPGALVGVLVDLGTAVPRLIERSLDQAGFARAVLERLPCFPLIQARSPGVGSADADGPLAEVVHLPGRPVPEARTVTDILAEPGDADEAEDSPEDDPNGGDTHDGFDAGDSEHLPIPEYDSLAASQVVPRLADLGAEELESVRRYESTNRARRTILNRIAQLQQS